MHCNVIVLPGPVKNPEKDFVQLFPRERLPLLLIGLLMVLLHPAGDDLETP